MDESPDAAVFDAAKRALATALRAAREAAGMTQSELSRRVDYSRSTIANAERGDQRSADLYARCDTALAAGGALVAAYEQVAATQRGTGMRQRPIATPPDAPVAELIEHLRLQWHLLIRTDNLLGPRVAMPTAHERLDLIGVLLRTACGTARVALRCLAARYAETTAWLCEDSGELAAADRWNGRALEWAHEVGDGRMVAWSLFRGSNLALARGELARALALAGAARRQPSELPASSQAAILQQEAHAHSARGDVTACLRRLDQADELAADADGDARYGHGDFCTPAYLGIQRATCWVRLGRPEQAVGRYRSAIARLPPVYHRERGLAIARLAAASAELGDVDDAAGTAATALGIARATGSARIHSTVVSVANRLAPHRRSRAVAAFLADIALDS